MGVEIEFKGDPKIRSITLSSENCFFEIEKLLNGCFTLKDAYATNAESIGNHDVFKFATSLVKMLQQTGFDFEFLL